ncbi:Hypp4807 [Branchiostoma lanceolatum]|uniref:Hypp4807 protein n=1 Tax=Branchiostoma lanceolatum TaxID=7740 RepID=A0A8K0F2D0_BRALA|nr:Hypp4807 [Branchiostoma lanceolatum]
MLFGSFKYIANFPWTTLIGPESVTSAGPPVERFQGSERSRRQPLTGGTGGIRSDSSLTKVWDLVGLALEFKTLF